MKRYIEGGTSKERCQIFRKDIFHRCFRPCEEQVLSAKQSLRSLFPDLPAVIHIPGTCFPRGIGWVGFSEIFNPFDNVFADSFFS